MFGYPVGIGNQIYREATLGYAHNSENRPVPADIAYDTTVSDILAQDAGWLEKAVATIKTLR